MEQKYWFTYYNKHYIVYEIVEDELHFVKSMTYDEYVSLNESSEHIGEDYEIVQALSDFIVDRDEGHLYFHLNRPEMLTVGDMKETYISVLKGICLHRINFNNFTEVKDVIKFVHPDKYLDRVNSVINWLLGTDFFTAPASTKYHGSFMGGLLEHSLEVAQQIIYLFGLPKFQNVDIVSAVLCAFVHDWCKIGRYIPGTRNVKNPETGVWETVAAYSKVDPVMPLGHGETSMYYASRCFNLSEEELLAIRWHMGEFHVVPAEMNELQTANQQYPLVNMLQFADRLSITNY